MNTKRMLLDAFYELMHEREFDDITVQMILDRSHLSRGTFYRYYTDKYDLMNSFYRIHVDDMLQQVGKTIDISDAFEQVFQHLQSNKNYYRRVLKTEGMESFLGFLEQYSYDFYRAKLEETVGTESIDSEASIRIEMFCAGHIAALKKWVERGCLESPKQMAHLCLEFIPEDLQGAGLHVSA